MPFAGLQSERERVDSLELNDVSGLNGERGGVLCAGDERDREDAVSAEGKEVVVNADVVLLDAKSKGPDVREGVLKLGAWREEGLFEL